MSGDEAKGEQLYAPLLAAREKERSYTEDSLALGNGSAPHTAGSSESSGGGGALFSWQMIFYANVFFACASFSLVLPSLWPYLQSIGPDWMATQTFLAWIVAAYSFGEAIGSLAFGAWYGAGHTSAKTCIIACMLVGLVGSCMYFAAGFPCFLDDPHGSGPWLLLSGRFVQGLWTGGQQALEQSYLSEVVSAEDRTAMTSTLGAFAVSPR